MFSEVKLVSEGYEVTFWPCKQEEKHSEEFLVPKIPDDETGVDYFSIVEKYIEVLNEEIRPTGNQSFWWRGLTKNGKRTLVNQHLGIDQFYKLPNFMAEVIF